MDERKFEKVIKLVCSFNHDDREEVIKAIQAVDAAMRLPKEERLELLKEIQKGIDSPSKT